MVGESVVPKGMPSTAAAEVEHSAVVRKAPLKDLYIQGCYLAMRHPFSKGASILVKIRTESFSMLCDGLRIAVAA
jgi:hypothetical protein